jgi:hypothetical protein
MFLNKLLVLKELTACLKANIFNNNEIFFI